MRESHGFIAPEFQTEGKSVASPQKGWPHIIAHLFVTLHTLCSRCKQPGANIIG
jgi:hypothetical protein